MAIVDMYSCALVLTGTNIQIMNDHEGGNRKIYLARGNLGGSGNS